METIAEFVTALRERSVSLTLSGDELRYRAPHGTLTPELLRQTAARKQEIIEYLRRETAPNPPAPLPRGCDGPLPLSFAQEALVNAYEKMTAFEGQHLSLTLRLRGPLDITALENALNAVVARHAVLRTRYSHEADGAVHAFADPTRAIPTDIIDLETLPESARDEESRRCIARWRTRRFDLQRGPLLRAGLIKLAQNHYVWAVIVHHSIFDAWSGGVLMREVLGAYGAISTGAAPTLPPLALQFSDYAYWLREWVDSPEGTEQYLYWERVLADIKQPFWLPQRTTFVSSADVDVPGKTRFRLSPATVSRLRELSQSEQTTIQAVLLAAYAAVLHLWSAAPAVLIAVLHFGRPFPPLSGLIGCFIQSWLLRVDLGRESRFKDVVRQATERMHQAQRYLQFPFGRLKPMLAQRSDETPLLHITFNYIPHMQRLAGGQAASPAGPLGIEEFETAKPSDILPEGRGEKLNLTAFDQGDSMELWVRYASSRFSPAAAVEFAEQLHALLESAAADPAVLLARVRA